MKIKFITLLMLLPITLSATNISILFIGNSFTKMNNFYQMVSDIGAQLGDTIYTEFSAFDSWTLEKHFFTQETIDKINSQCWDYIILQEQSQLPAMDITTFNNKTLCYAEKILEIIYNNNSETTPLLFMTWGRKYGDKELCQKLSYTCTYEGMQDTLINRYYLLGDILGINVVPCGIAWKYFSSNSPNHINLFYEDDKHSNEIGSYLNALCFYSAITGKSAEGTIYNLTNVSVSEVSILQKIAFETIKNNYK